MNIFLLEVDEVTEKEKNVQQDTEITVATEAEKENTDSKLNSNTLAPETEAKPKKPAARKRSTPKKTEATDSEEKTPKKAPARKKNTAKKAVGSEKTEAPLVIEDVDLPSPATEESVTVTKEPTVASPKTSVTEEAAAVSEEPTETEADAVPELPSDGEIVIPIFDISKDDLPLPSDEEEEYFEEDTAEEFILPPDMLFSKMQEEINETPTEKEDASHGSDDEGGESSYEEEETESEEEDDRQYTIDDLYAKEEKKSDPPSEYNPKKPRRVDSRFDFIELFVFTLVFVMILMSFFFRHSIVNGSSMENTLHDGEHLIISDLFYTPKRGDVIVVEDHTTNLKYPIVKRVIAVGGDTVKITETEVLVNGVPEKNPHVYFGNSDYTYTPYEITVPKGELFVMGDHRDNSTDSRDPVMLGTVSEDAVLGKVLFRFFPFDKFGTID